MSRWRDKDGRYWEGSAPPGAELADMTPAGRLWAHDEFFERYGVDMYDIWELEPQLWDPDIGDR